MGSVAYNHPIGKIHTVYHLYTTYSPCQLGDEKCYRSHRLSGNQKQLLSKCPQKDSKVLHSFDSHLHLFIPHLENRITGWWQLEHFLFSSRTLGRISILTHIFQVGWFNHQLEFYRVVTMALEKTVCCTNRSKDTIISFYIMKNTRTWPFCICDL